MPAEIDLQLIATSMHAIAGIDTTGASPELVSAVVRRKAASEGKALNDGSFPIRNVADLQRAVQAFGRAKDKDRAKRFIMKRARELKREDLIPDQWKTNPAKAFELIDLSTLDITLPEYSEPMCQFSGLPKTQKCKYGDEPATKRVVWAEGMAYIPVCENHLAKAKHRIEVENKDEVTKILAVNSAEETEFVKAPGPCSLDRSAKHNWVEDVGGLPNYVCQVARAVARGGRTLDSAIPIAIGTLKNWAAGKGNVSAAVRARAAAAIAEWEAKKARARANSVDPVTFEMDGDDEHLIDLLVDFATEPGEKDVKKYVRTVSTGEKNPVHVGRRGPYRKSGRTITRNKRKVVLRLDGKPDGRSLRTDYKRFPATAPAGLGGQFAPLGRGVKATKKKYGTANSLEENVTAELASTGDTVVIKDGPYKGKQGRCRHVLRRRLSRWSGWPVVWLPSTRTICEKKEVAITASGAALWDEDAFTYYWDEKSDSTFRIAEEDSTRSRCSTVPFSTGPAPTWPPPR
jgi:hypothetical protein